MFRIILEVADLTSFVIIDSRETDIFTDHLCENPTLGRIKKN